MDVASPEARLVAHYRLVGETGTWTSASAGGGQHVLSIDADPDRADLVDWSALGFQAP